MLYSPSLPVLSLKHHVIPQDQLLGTLYQLNRPFLPPLIALRYAGVIAFGVLGIWMIREFGALRAAGRLLQATLAVVSATLAAASLLLWNLVTLGHFSGADRSAQGGLGWHAWPGHLADLGWSLPAAFMLGGLRERIASGWLVEGAGWAFSVGGAALCAWAFLRPRQPWVRACALVALTYGAGMVLLRSIGSFDALYGARTFLPVIFPMGLALAGQCHGRGRWIPSAAAGIILASGIASAGRGMSQQIGGDVRAAVPVLRARLHPNDVVQLDDRALSLAAFIPQRTDRVWPGPWYGNKGERFLVVAARPTDRSGTPAPFDPAWLGLCDRLVAQGSHRWLLETPRVLVLERIERKPATSQ